MAVNRKKLIQLLLQQIEDVEERCPDYKSALRDSLTDILELERQKRIHGTHIRQKVADKCAALGEFLTRNRVNSN
ncbi:MAG: hypothetical protein ACE5HI_01280 [bacterium]